MNPPLIRISIRRVKYFKNKFNITNQSDLDDAESDITSLEIAGLLVNGFPLSDPVTLDTYRAIHRQLFADIYNWAGEIRTINIEKDSTKFCEYRFIETEAQRIFSELRGENLLSDAADKDTYLTRLAYYYSELNMLHPFREGNGRTLRTFISILAMNNNNYAFAWDKMDPRENIEACAYASYHDESKIATMLAKIIEDHNEPTVTPPKRNPTSVVQ